RYYDSLRLFSPRRYSAFPGHRFPGDPDGYPGRDEVADYLRGYAEWLGVEVRTNARVTEVAADDPGFAVELADGSSLVGDALIAASGVVRQPLRADDPRPGEISGPGPARGRLPVAGGVRRSAGRGRRCGQLCRPDRPRTGRPRGDVAGGAGPCPVCAAGHCRARPALVVAVHPR